GRINRRSHRYTLRPSIFFSKMSSASSMFRMMDDMTITLVSKNRTGGPLEQTPALISACVLRSPLTAIFDQNPDRVTVQT
ncbi:MAG TPA: hypothetical protein VES89_04045, partial [Candidatus Competibacteraceae bacterium]|nr:hypothetical protein [Candidatus Competibacteraceae bacterium]